MSMISLGAIFSRTPLKEADLAEIDRVLAARTSNLVRTRKGRVWEFINGSVVLDVRGESVQSVLWDRESDLLSLGLLPDPGCFRVSITAGYRSDEIDRGISQLCESIAAATGGVRIGPRHGSLPEDSLRLFPGPVQSASSWSFQLSKF